MSRLLKVSVGTRQPPAVLSKMGQFPQDGMCPIGTSPPSGVFKNSHVQ